MFYRKAAPLGGSFSFSEALRKLQYSIVHNLVFWYLFSRSVALITFKFCLVVCIRGISTRPESLHIFSCEAYCNSVLYCNSFGATEK